MSRDEAIEYALQQIGFMSSGKPGHDREWVLEKVTALNTALQEQGFAVLSTRESFTPPER